MIQHILRFGTGVAFSIVLLSSAAAQEKQPPMKEKAPEKPAFPRDGLEEYRQYFKKPVEVDDFWRAMQFEIDVGQYARAAALLHALVTKPPTEAELVALETKYGLAAFLKLRTLPPLRERGVVVPRWSEDPKIQKQTLDDIDTLINGITDAVQKKLAKRELIVKWVQALNTAPEEAAFALKELYSYGPAAVPPLIDALRVAEGDNRRTLRRALTKLSDDVIAPLLAALDSDDPELILDVLGILVERGAKEAVPHLWYLSASPEQPERVRARATAALAYFLDTPASKLPPAKVALTREAERYFQHRVTFSDAKKVIVWRWDKTMTIVKGWPNVETIPQTKAEEYYGLLYARQALALDPAYQPAQETLLSLTLEKTLENADLSLPLAKISPPVHELLTTINPDVLNAVFERAMTEKRSTIVLACVRALGELVEVRASKPTGHGEPSLVRALVYGDKRVQMAAAEALLRMPNPPSLQASQHILEILIRNLAVVGQVSARPKALVASADADARLRIAQAVVNAGYETVPVASGREALRRLNAANDISAIVVESTITDPTLASFLAQVRADVNASRLPILVIAVPDNAETRALVLEYREQHDRVQYIVTRTAGYRKLRLDLQIQYEQSRDRIMKSSNYDKPGDREASLLILDERHKEELKELANRYPEPSVLDGQSQDIEKKMQIAADRYLAESLKREEALKHWLDNVPTVTVVSTGFLEDTKKLQVRLQGEEGKTETIPLTEAEQKEYAERAIAYFARMARGEITGYDLREEKTLIGVYDALQGGKLSEKGQADAIDIVVRQPAGRSQVALAAVVLDGKRSLPLRLKATDELIKHIQQNSRLLPNDQVARLQKLYEDTGAAAPELKEFKAKLAVLQGAFRPDTRTTGERLRDYQPPLPMPPKMEP